MQSGFRSLSGPISIVASAAPGLWVKRTYELFHRLPFLLDKSLLRSREFFLSRDLKGSPRRTPAAETAGSRRMKSLYVGNLEAGESGTGRSDSEGRRARSRVQGRGKPVFFTSGRLVLCACVVSPPPSRRRPFPLSQCHAAENAVPVSPGLQLE